MSRDATRLRQTLASVWPLFFGLALIGVCVGGQGTLLGVRATLDGFDTRVTGVVMSGYFVGFLLGSLYGPAAIQRVGHVRTFGALTALASVAVLVHAIWVEPIVWTLMRLVTGFAISGIYVVAESWLNQAATEKTRGQILSLYMIIMLLGLCAGQFLLGVASPAGFKIFSVVSVLLSLAAIPILVTALPTPVLETHERLSVKDLLGWAPLGVVGAFAVSAGFGMLFGMAPVFATQSGLSVQQVSVIMATMLLGGTLSQWPLGHLSDRVDRRAVICAAALGAGLACALLGLLAPSTRPGYLLLLALFGACFMPLYALAIALTNDFLPPARTVAASGTLLLVGGLGASFGPTAIAFAMNSFGNESFFFGLAALCTALGAYAGWRLAFRPYVPEARRSAFAMHAPTGVGAVLHPEPAPDASTGLARDAPDGGGTLR